jgi:hypothetical protein
VGAQYIDQCINHVMKNEIMVLPAYQPDLPKAPAVYVLSNTSEGNQFIGDYGQDSLEVVHEPEVYATFSATGIVDDVISVSYDQHIEQKVWRNVILTNGTAYARLDSVGPARQGYPTQLYLNHKLPVGTRLENWRAQSHPVRTGFSLKGSLEDVRVQAKLRSPGDPSVHRLLAIVIRACLKSGRLLFDSYGLQTPTFSQGYMQPIEGEGILVCETDFSIDGKLLETWVDHEFTAGDDTVPVDVQVTAVPQPDQAGDKEVALDEETS